MILQCAAVHLCEHNNNNNDTINNNIIRFDTKTVCMCMCVPTREHSRIILYYTNVRTLHNIPIDILYMYDR